VQAGRVGRRDPPRLRQGLRLCSRRETQFESFLECRQDRRSVALARRHLGAGTVDDKRGFSKRLEEQYFLPSPEQFVFDHLPDDPKWQLLKLPISEDTYRSWPRVDVALLRSGVSAQDIVRAFSERDFRGLVESFAHLDRNIQLCRIPLERQLKSRVPYQFRIEATTCLDLAIINGDRWHYFSQKDGIFEKTLSPEKGTLKVSGKFSDKEKTYWTLLQYVVE